VDLFFIEGVRPKSERVADAEEQGVDVADGGNAGQTDNRDKGEQQDVLQHGSTVLIATYSPGDSGHLGHGSPSFRFGTISPSINTLVEQGFDGVITEDS
jgi:hypothetical protein